MGTDNRVLGLGISAALNFNNTIIANRRKDLHRVTADSEIGRRFISATKRIVTENDFKQLEKTNPKLADTIEQRRAEQAEWNREVEQRKLEKKVRAL